MKWSCLPTYREIYVPSMAERDGEGGTAHLSREEAPSGPLGPAPFGARLRRNTGAYWCWSTISTLCEGGVAQLRSTARGSMVCCKVSRRRDTDTDTGAQTGGTGTGVWVARCCRVPYCFLSDVSPSKDRFGCARGGSCGWMQADPNPAQSRKAEVGMMFARVTVAFPNAALLLLLSSSSSSVFFFFLISHSKLRASSRPIPTRRRQPPRMYDPLGGCRRLFVRPLAFACTTLPDTHQCPEWAGHVAAGRDKTKRSRLVSSDARR